MYMSQRFYSTLSVKNLRSSFNFVTRIRMSMIISCLALKRESDFPVPRSIVHSLSFYKLERDALYLYPKLINSPNADSSLSVFDK